MEQQEYLTANYHTHTARCGHAQGADEDYVQAAIAAGIKILGFSDHMPWPKAYDDERLSGIHMGWDQAAEYVASIRSLQEKYKDQIQIHVGFEAEYLPYLFDEQLQMCEDLGVEYLILGQHFLNGACEGKAAVMKTTEELALRTYLNNVLEGLSTGKYTYLCHPDLINYQGDDRIYYEAMRYLCEETKSMDIPLEINLLGAGDGRNYPSDRFFAIAGEVGNDVIIGIDAHEPESIGNQKAYLRGMEYVNKYGLHLLKKLPEFA